MRITGLFGRGCCSAANFAKLFFVRLIGQWVVFWHRKQTPYRFNYPVHRIEFTTYFLILLHSTGGSFLGRIFFRPHTNQDLVDPPLRSNRLVLLPNLKCFAAPLLHEYGPVSRLLRLSPLLLPLAPSPVLTLRAKAQSANDGRQG